MDDVFVGFGVLKVDWLVARRQGTRDVPLAGPFLGIDHTTPSPRRYLRERSSRVDHPPRCAMEAWPYGNRPMIDALKVMGELAPVAC